MGLSLILIQVGVMLSVAMLFGQIMRKMGQPAILGEFLGGIVLGPTIFGTLSAEGYHLLFPTTGAFAVTRDVFINIGMLFFLFTSGLEVSSEQLRRVGFKVTSTCLMGIAVPFALGAGSVWLWPGLWHHGVATPLLPLSLFVGLALSISALPVIARILVDLGLIKGEIGSVILSAATINDLIGWSLFAFILALYMPGKGHVASLPLVSLGLTAVFVPVVMVGGRRLGPMGFRFIRHRLPWPSSFIGATAILVLLGAATSDMIGMHAIFGAFLMGVALNQEFQERDVAHEVIHQFSISFFAPLYFVSLGLKVNFLKDFDPLLVALVLVIACGGKILGAALGARIGGMNRREALMVGSGLNARGVMELVLATVALEQRLIDERIFVALFVMAVVTSMMAGPLLKHFMRQEQEA